MNRVNGYELVIKRRKSFDVREEAARATLRDVRLRGHIYVELREVGKRTIFFCTLCLTPCYSDSSLFDHLRGSLHSRRYEAAKATLLGPVPWPFNDGVLFFSTAHEQEQLSSISSSRKDIILHPNSNDWEVASTAKDGGSLKSLSADANLGVHMVMDLNGNTSCRKDLEVVAGRSYFKPSGSGNNQEECHVLVAYGQSISDETHGSSIGMNELDKNLMPNNHEQCIAIPRVLIGEEPAVQRLHFIGYGHIAARICRSDEVASKVRRIWCAWLGKGEPDDINKLKDMPRCEFGVVNFSYTPDLGRPDCWDDVNSSPSYGSQLGIKDVDSSKRTKGLSFSDADESPKNSRDTYAAVSENNALEAGNGRITPHTSDGMFAESTSCTKLRRELRRQKRLAAERLCDICGQPMLVGKDVATLLNQKIWNLACSSRNNNGAFHVFHSSCLIHWILICEFATWNPKLPNKKPHRGRKGKRGAKAYMSSILCPECQGTGVISEDYQLEKPTIPLSEMFLYKLKAIESHMEWMKSPEILQNCSTGLNFSGESEEKFQEQNLPMKLLHFYRADY